MASFATNSTIVKLSRSVTRQNEKVERLARDQQDSRLGRMSGKKSQFQVNMAKVRSRKEEIPDEPERPRHPSPPGVTAEELLEEYTNRDTAHRFKLMQRNDPEVLMTNNLYQQKKLQLQKIQHQILDRTAQPQDLSNIRKKLWLMRNSHDRARKVITRDLDKLSDRCKRKLDDMRKHLGVLRGRKQREEMLEHELTELSDTNSKWQRQIDELKLKKTSENIMDLTNNYRKILISRNTAKAYRDAAEKPSSEREELIFARDPRYAGSVASCLLASAGMEVHQETRITKIERRRFFVDELRGGINSLVNNNSVHGREWKFYKNMIALLDQRVAEARQFMEERCVQIVTHMREKSDVMAKQLSRFDNERDLLILFQRQIQTDMLAVSHKESDFLKNFSDLVQELTAKVGFFEARQLFIRDKPSAKLMRRLNSLPIHILQAGAASLGPGHPKTAADFAAGGGGDAGATVAGEGTEPLGANASKIGESASAVDMTTSADEKNRSDSKPRGKIRRKFSLRRSKNRSKSNNRSKKSKSRSLSKLRKLFGRKSKSRSKSRNRDKTRSNSKRRRKFVPSFRLPSLSKKRGKKGKSKEKKNDLASVAADAGIALTPPTTPATTAGEETDDGSKKRFRRKKSKSRKTKKEKPMKIKKITVKIDKHRKQLAKNHIVPLEYEIYEDGDADPPLEAPPQPAGLSSRSNIDLNSSAPNSVRSNSAKGSVSARSILLEPDDDRPDDPLMQDEMKLVDGRTDFNRLRRLHKIRTQAVQKLLKRIELNGVYLLRNVERVTLLACFLTETPTEDAEGTPVQDLHDRWALLIDPAELKMITGASVFVKERDSIQ